jgi:hypothetical protein
MSPAEPGGFRVREGSFRHPPGHQNRANSHPTRPLGKPAGTGLASLGGGVGACSLEDVDELGRVFLAEVLLDRLGSAVDEGLRLGQTKAGGLADSLDDGDLVGAGGLEDDVELGLLSWLGGGATSVTGDDDRASGATRF